MNKIIISFVFLLFIIISCGTGYDGPITVTNRNLVIDFPNTLFNSADAANQWDRGLGISTVTVTATALNSQKQEIAYTLVITAADIDPTYSFTQLALNIEGELLRISAETSGGTQVFTASMEDKSNYDRFFGWTLFANIEKVKLDFSIATTDPATGKLLLMVGPRGGSSASLLVDSGAQGPGEGITDRKTVLIARQIAVQTELMEHPADIKIEVYGAVVTENLTILYNQDVTFEALYNETPWDPSWSYEEIREKGKTINGKLYTLEKLSGEAPLDVLNPQGAGYKAFLIDLTGNTDPDIVGKYMLIAVVLRHENLFSPIDLVCVEIK